MEFLNNLKKETKELLTAIFSTIKEVDETQIDKLIYMAAKVEDGNCQLKLFNHNTTTYKKIKEGLQIYENNMFKEIYILCNGKQILEDSVINTLAYYAGMRGKYLYGKNNPKTI